MREVKRVDNESDCKLIDPIVAELSRRPGDRAVAWLVVFVACVATIVISIAIVRSREKGLTDHPNAQHANAPVSMRGFSVVRVVDGDTIIVVGQDNIKQTLRFDGIDAPEKDQPFGAEATEFVENLLDDKRVSLDNVDRDKYGRLLANVYVDSRWVELEIIQHGWAWVYPGSESRALREAEMRAREEVIGLWSSESQVPPWEWRTGRR